MNPSRTFKSALRITCTLKRVALYVELHLEHNARRLLWLEFSAYFFLIIWDGRRCSAFLSSTNVELFKLSLFANSKLLILLGDS